MSVRPIEIDLVGTRGDDLYFKFQNFTIDGKSYDAADVPEMYIELVGTPATNYTATGTLSGSTVTFKIPAASNAVVGKYNYDVQVTYQNGDKFTHIVGTIDISDDVNKS